MNRLKNGNTAECWVSHVCALIGSLQCTLSQIRFLEQLRYELDTEFALQDGEENELAEIMHCGVGLYRDQAYDLATLNKRHLIKKINNLLSKHPETETYQLKEEPQYKYRVDVNDDITTKVQFIGVGTYEELDAQKYYQSPEDGVCLWVSQRDFREVLKSRSELGDDRGEFYKADGLLGRLFWPFLIDLDGTCVAVNDMMDNVLELECSEK